VKLAAMSKPLSELESGARRGAPAKPPSGINTPPVDGDASVAAFADSFADLPESGKQPAFTGNAAGSPAETVDNIIFSKPAASQDAGGAVTLPPIDAGAVNSAATPQAAAQAMGEATGVSKVNLVPAEDKVEYELEINPVTKGGSSKPKSPSERPELKPQLDKLHDAAKPIVVGIVDERKYRYTRAKDWADAKAKLETEDRIKQILDKPMNLDSNPFGAAMQTIAIAELNKALKAEGHAPLNDVDAGVKLAHWKPQINEEVGPFAPINKALKDNFWDKGASPAAVLNTAFSEKLKLGEGEEHDWYRPIGRAEITHSDGSSTITYKNAKGAAFTVQVGADNMVKSNTGTKLSLKEPGTRGATTGDSGRKVPNENMQASHLIADRFRGSGYKSGANLITTSAHYNVPLMSGVEDQIANFVKANKATTDFDLTVSVEWMEINDQSAIDLFFAENPKMKKKDYEAGLQADMKAFAARMKTESPNLKRVQSTKYDVKCKGEDGEEAAEQFNLGVDIWMGSGSAPG
jgi:hypothetical protein